MQCPKHVAGARPQTGDQLEWRGPGTPPRAASGMAAVSGVCLIMVAEVMMGGRERSRHASAVDRARRQLRVGGFDDFDGADSVARVP